jgi:hypothetical protein
MKEYAQSKGPFKKWESARMQGTRAAFLRDASEIIRSVAQRAFVSLVSHAIFSEFDSRFKLSDTFSSPYALTGRLCIAHANRWRQKNISGALQIEHVFEDGGPDKGGLLNSIRAFPPYVEVPSFKPSRNMPPSHKWPDGRVGVIQLQAADYLAYEMRKLLVDYELIKQGGRQTRMSLRALVGVPLDRALVTPARLQTICRLARIEKRDSAGPVTAPSA